MELNNNREFYKKLFARIVLVFCLFFVVATNILRLQQLQEKPSVSLKMSSPKPLILYSIVFQSVVSQDKSPRIVFIENNPKSSYLKNVFSFIKKNSYEQIFIVDCSSSDVLFLENYFSSNHQDIPLDKISCSSSQEEFSQILTPRNLIVFVFGDKNFKHSDILRVAEDFSLKPSIRLSEINHAN